MWVYLDLDRVLVDVIPGWRKHFIRPVAAATLRPVDVVEQIAESIWMAGDLYSPEGHLRAMGASRSNRHVAEALGAYYEWLDAGGAVYPDVQEFFERNRGKCQFGIISFGEGAYQRRKLVSLPVPGEFFGLVHITVVHPSKGEVISDHQTYHNEPVLLADDNREELEAAVPWVAPDGVLIQMKRSADIRHSEHAEFHIEDLEGLDKFLSDWLR